MQERKPLYKNNREAFQVHIAEAWLEKNRPILGNKDMISETLERINLKPTRLLDVGCSNGWLMKRLRDKYGCQVYGIEPSKAVVDTANSLLGEECVFKATVDRIPFEDKSFDMVIFGFSLYFIGPEDWMSAAAEADRVLIDGGHIVVNDYLSPRPYAKPSAGYKDVYGYYHDWIKLWMWHPAYQLITEGVVQATSDSCAVLKKNMTHAIPVLVPDTRNEVNSE